MLGAREAALFKKTTFFFGSSFESLPESSSGNGENASSVRYLFTVS